MSERPFYKATRRPHEVYWRPVTETKIIDIDGNPRKQLTLNPGENVELWTPEGQHWSNEPEQFVRNYELVDRKAQAIFRKHYPGVLPE